MTEPSGRTMVKRDVALSIGAMLALLGVYTALAMSVQTITAEPPVQLRVSFNIVTGGVLLLLALCTLAAQWIRSLGVGVRRYLLCLGILLALLSVDELFSVHQWLNDADELGVAIWIGIGVAIIWAMRRADLNRQTLLFLQGGWIVHGLAAFADSGDGGLFIIEGVPVQALRWTVEVFELVGVSLYAVGFPLLRFGRASAQSNRRPIAHAAVVLADTAGRVSSITLASIDYLWWRLQRRGGDFATYYADSISRKLRRGGAHPTLGPRERRRGLRGSVVLTTARHARRGAKVAGQLLATLNPPRDRTVVDYGCGSLRIGQHFMAYLERGRYFGLDITDQFYRDGLALLPPELVETSAPRLAVIDAESLREAREANPALIFSVSVVMHIPSAELGRFFDRTLSIRNTDTRLAIYFDETPVYMRTHARSWAYPATRLEEEVRTRLPEARITVTSGPVIAHFGPVEIKRSLLLIDPPAGGWRRPAGQVLA